MLGLRSTRRLRGRKFHISFVTCEGKAPGGMLSPALTVLRHQNDPRNDQVHPRLLNSPSVVPWERASMIVLPRFSTILVHQNGQRNGQAHQHLLKPLKIWKERWTQLSMLLLEGKAVIRLYVQGKAGVHFFDFRAFDSIKRMLVVPRGYIR